MAAIIFDLDGTIVDSFDYVADFLASSAGRQLSSEQKDSLRGLSVVAMARQLGYHWWQGPMLLYRGRRRMHAAINELHAFSGMPEIIRKLHAEGHELFVLSSNSARNIKAFLRQQSLQDFFLQVYGDAGIFGKPATLRRLLREQNIDRHNAVYVGDEIRDVEAAKVIGMRSVAVAWGFSSRAKLRAARPTHLVRNTAQLMQVLEEI